MHRFRHPNLIRVPIKLRDSRWEYFYGGGLPIADGTVGYLAVDRSSIKDKHFLAYLTQTAKHKILAEGTRLLVALTVKSPSNLSRDLQNHLLPGSKNSPQLGVDCFSTPRSSDTRFVPVNIGGPTERQKRHDPSETGGVWLHVEGLVPKVVSSSTVLLPSGVANRPANSLNHAFTLLSERYEPWRDSHTGNIYERMLYREKNGKWYPLDVLREAALANDEHEFLSARWTEILNAVSPKSRR